MNRELLRVARDWVVGKEVDLLKLRIRVAVENFEESDSYDPELRGDLEAYAEELQVYSSCLESIPLRWLMALLDEYLV